MAAEKVAEQAVTMAGVADKALDKATVVVEKAAAAATDVFSAASGIITRGIEQYGSQVIDAVLWVVRIDAIQVLIYGWITALISAFIVGFIWTGFTRRKWSSRITSNHNDGIEYLGIILTVIGAVAVFSLAALPRITDVWLYTAMVKPELYLVKKTIDMVEARLNAPAKK